MSQTIVTVALAKATLIKINNNSGNFNSKTKQSDGVIYGDVVYRQVERRIYEIVGSQQDNHTLDDNFTETSQSAVNLFNTL